MVTPVNSVNGTKLLIRLGDGATPETFTHHCVINTNRGIEFTSSPIETLIPNCPPDDDEPGWVSREVDGLSCSIPVAGMLDTRSYKPFRDWFLSGNSRNIQVELVASGADGGGHWFGAAIISGHKLEAAGNKNKVTFEGTLMSDGAWAWVDTA
jgi:hypothetical protein